MLSSRRTSKIDYHHPFFHPLLGALINLCKEYHNRVYKLQEDKWDLELATGTKELEINELKEHVNDQRGKL